MSDHPEKKRKKSTEKGVPTLIDGGLSSSRVDISFEKSVEVCKVDDELGLVFGWAMICTEGGEDYFDLQGDNITEDAMLKAAAGYMEKSRDASEMHARDNAGQAIFAFPITKATKEAFGITCDRTGLLFAMKPDEVMLAKFKSGELKGFSIGGRRGEDLEV